MEIEQRETKSRIEEREITLNQISKEVHDHVGQVSNVLRMTLHMVEELATDQQQLQLIKTCSDYADQIVSSVHDISHSLNGDYIRRRGLFNVISDQIDRIQSSRKIECDLEIENFGEEIPAEASLVIYRIAQEALNNILKHSKATMIKVHLIHRGCFFEMMIMDNGIGLPSGKESYKGLGLSNMRERARILGGRLTCTSYQGSGTSILLVIEDLMSRNLEELSPSVNSNKSF